MRVSVVGRVMWAGALIVSAQVARGQEAPSGDNQGAKTDQRVPAGPVLEPGAKVPAVGGPGEKWVESLVGTSLSIEMVSVPAGTLSRVDPLDASKREEIAVSAHWMSATEITWDLYDVFAFRLDEADPSQPLADDAVTRPSKPYLPADRGFGHAGFPTISLAFQGANEFCRWLSEKTGRGYRLATVDEWEWACRAGATDEEIAASIDEIAWHKGNASETTKAVAQKRPNAWGLYDMLGNASEWARHADGKGRQCGGSFLDAPGDLKPSLALKQRAAWNTRDPQMPKSKWWLSDGPFAGFRIVCDPQAAPSPETPK